VGVGTGENATLCGEGYTLCGEGYTPEHHPNNPVTPQKVTRKVTPAEGYK
jgi:hypothetical protein